MKRQILFVHLAVVALVISVAVPGSAQQFVWIANSEALNLAPGAVSLWGQWACTDCEFNATYQFTANQFHQISTPTQFATISVGGGSVMQFDEVWATDFNGNIFQWNNYTQAFQQVSGSLQNVVVGEGYTSCHPYEVWGTNSSNEVFRYNYCSFGWDPISGFFSGLATGGGEIWALNGYDQIFRYDFATNQFDLMPGQLTQISVGAGGVWGTYTGNNSVWQFNPSTKNWEQLPGSMSDISAGSDGVFGSYVDPYSGQNSIYRLDPSTRTWTLIYNNSGGWDGIDCLRVGTGAGTWMSQGIGGNTYYYLSF